MPVCALLFALLCPDIAAQPQSAGSSASGALEQALAIEEPAARITALQRFIRSNSIPQQTQTAREAIVASWAQAADAHLGENEVEKAVENFRRALAALPEKITDRFFEETVVRIPYAVSVRGYRTEAAALAAQLEKRFAKEAQRLASLGEFYMTIEAPVDAIRSLENATKLSDDDPRLHRLLGASYRMGLRLDEAIAAYQLAIKYDPKDKRAYYELGNLYRAFGANADAIKLYRRQLEIEPKHSPSFKGQALAYLAQGNEDQSIASLNQARDIRGSVEEITEDVYLQTQMAFHYLAQKNMRKARQAAERALVVEPRYSWARIAAAEVDLAEGKYFDAERNLLAARQYAAFPSFYFTLGKLYLSVEDFDGALEQFAKAFNYSPQNQFTAKLGGVLDVQSGSLKELLLREHQAAIFLAEPPTSDEVFKAAESLVRFHTQLRNIKTPSAAPPASNAKGERVAARNTPAIILETVRKQMIDLDKSAMDFIEVENVRRSFRMLHIAERLATAGVALGLAIELSDLAVGLAEAATEPEGSLRDYPNYDRNGRLSIFRGRALDAKGWALFKAGDNRESIAVLGDAVRAYGELPEARRAIRHLATVRESQGELKEALDLHVAAYEPAENGAETDVNRAVIESLYRKINGSLDGLNELLGISNTASINQPSPTTVKTAARPKAGANEAAKIEPKPEKHAAKKAPQTKLPIPSFSKPDQPAGFKPFDTMYQPVRDAAAVPPPPPIAPIPIELPAIDRPEITISFNTVVDNNSAIIPPFDNPDTRSRLAEVIPSPPPPPKLHTRKRRVTVPDDPPHGG
jgi:tetratricopeptide (TPR) repeat protein